LFESDFLLSAANSKNAYRRYISQAAQIICEFFPNQPYRGESARTLADLIGANFLPEQEASSELIGQTLRTIVSNSIAVSNSGTTAHLHCPPLLPALAAEVVISALNQSMDSFDQAPVATVVEQKMVRWLCNQAGQPVTADGTFTTGGSQSNYMALLLARDTFLQKRWNWYAQKQGLHPEARRLRILCSEVAHFTVEKSASQLGLGAGSVVRVAVDDHFRMSPAALRSELEKLQAQDLLPMAIVGTAGTTDFGSVDPLPELAALARASQAWFHVDAAYGGALLFSPQHRHKLAGIELADSISIDFHKLFWQPIPCSAFLLRDAANFASIRMHADYLNPELHEQEGVPDLVTTSLLTSRRFDALKLWISLQSLGRKKLAEMIDRTVFLAHHAAATIQNNERLELMCEPQLSTVVFRYVPPNSGITADEINAAVRQNLFNRGRAVIGHTRVRNQQCLKFTCMNPAVTESQMDDLIRLIAQEAGNLAAVCK
jgi:L-2,4-diaminobutyrate decarboxylase